MKKSTSYILLIIAAMLICLSCAEEYWSVEVSRAPVSFCANKSLLITKSGLQYSRFDINTRYLLYGVESSSEYEWDRVVMYDMPGYENELQQIDYGKDIFFDGKRIDFYGATLCSTENIPQNVNQPGAPVIGLDINDCGGSFPDLMYSNNLKGCSAQSGLLEMNFTHALSKVQVEVSRQNDPELEGVIIKSVSIVDAWSRGRFSVVEGRWSDLQGKSEMLLSAEEMVVRTEPLMMSKEGREAYTLIIPNELSEDVLSLHIVLETKSGEEKAFTYPLYAAAASEDPLNEEEEAFIFEQNHRYVLSIILLVDGVRVIAVSPQAYDWIDVPVDTYMGQPVNFGNLMWMDRNLGAFSADCENDWANTRGYYYQHGRNIPYIYDHEKFLYRNKSVKNEYRARTGKETQLDIGYEYFYTYDAKGNRVYGAVQGGTLNCHYFYHVDTLNVSGQRIGWVNEGAGWEWKGSRLVNYSMTLVPHFLQTDGSFNSQAFWTVEQVGYNNTSSSTAWTESNGAPRWNGPNVTTSNIAINPGDPGIYHFIFDARYYVDYFQSGAWCVNDCADPYNWNHWRPLSIDEWNTYYNGWQTNTSYPTYKGWMLGNGCADTRTEDTDKVNYNWATAAGTPIPDNHPCPKGWRIPTKEDFANIIPDHNIDVNWAVSTNTMRVLDETYGDVLDNYKESVIYGVDKQGRKVIYIIKRKGEEDSYRLRLLWKDSNLYRNEYYDLMTASDDYPMQYLEIARYPSSSSMNFDKYFNAEVGSIVTTNVGQATTGTSSIYKTVRLMSDDELTGLGFYSDFDWDVSAEVMQIPICGFIYTTLGVDGMFEDGLMTILRCTDWSNNYDLAKKLRPIEEGGLGLSFTEGAYPYNEAMNWCMYVRTDRNTGLFSGSRKSLGAQIRCVRDINAK